MLGLSLKSMGTSCVRKYSQALVRIDRSSSGERFALTRHWAKNRSGLRGPKEILDVMFLQPKEFTNVTIGHPLVCL